MALTAIPALALAVALPAGPAPGHDRPTIPRFVTISDAEHAVRTYVDGVLAPDDGRQDLLTVSSLRHGRVSSASTGVTNSVTGPPEVMALSPDGDTAYVVERLARRGPDDATAADLAPGRTLSTVDLTGAPRVVATTEVAASPEAVSVSPDGERLAVVGTSTLQVLPLVDGLPGTPVTTDLAALGLGPGLTTQVHWHPSGRRLAVNVTDRDLVGFLTVRDDLTAGLWGAPVTTGTDPFTGRFTPDGRYYLTANWGRDLDAPDLAGRLPQVPSTVQPIRLGRGADPAHRPLAAADSDRSSEGIAMSPSGRLVATVNMRNTAYPVGTPGRDEQGTVSLLRLDPRTGRMTKLDDAPLDGALPEGGTFDRTGRWFLATVYESARGSGVQVYRVRGDELVAAQFVPLPAGTHHVVVPG